MSIRRNRYGKYNYRNNEGIEYIQFKRLLEYPEVTHCYTMRSNNQLNFQIKNIDFFRQSCDRILKSLNLENTDCCKEHIKHITDTVEKIEKVKNIDELKDVDGVVTNKKDICTSYNFCRLYFISLI